MSVQDLYGQKERQCDIHADGENLKNLKPTFENSVCDSHDHLQEL